MHIYRNSFPLLTKKLAGDPLSTGGIDRTYLPAFRFATAQL